MTPFMMLLLRLKPIYTDPVLGILKTPFILLLQTFINGGSVKNIGCDREMILLPKCRNVKM